ncbi:MAG: CBS domain-containing protein [Geminicoccaceae bacterium]
MAMAPTSYRGPLVSDDPQERTYSQTEKANLAELGLDLTVGAMLEDMAQPVMTAHPDATVYEVIELLSRNDIGALPVATNDMICQGIISERDIVRDIPHMGLKLFASRVRQIMTRDPITCEATTKLGDIMQLMASGRFRHLPVVSHNKLIGVVSIRDVVRYRVMQLEYENLKIKQAMVG